MFLQFGTTVNDGDNTTKGVKLEGKDESFSSMASLDTSNTAKGRGVCIATVGDSQRKLIIGTGAYM